MCNGQNGQSGQKWTQTQNKIMRKNVNGQNGQSGHKFKIKS